MARAYCSLLVATLIFVTSSYVLFLPLVIGHHMTPSTSPSVNKERHALFRTGWWNHNQNISNHCHWDGIDCNEAGSVTKIDTWDLNIHPSSELRQIRKLNVTAFPNLVILSLKGMGLTGSIPAAITTLTKLTTLDLFGNHLQGKSPEALSKLTQLEVLEVNGNSPSGVIPSSLEKLKNLKSLYLSFNQFEGSIPA